MINHEGKIAKLAMACAMFDDLVEPYKKKLAIAKKALDAFLGKNNVGRCIDLSIDWSGSSVSIVTDGAILKQLNDARKALEELGE